MLTDGWEFFILNPLDKNIKQTTQDQYLDMYNKSYNKFIYDLCIPEPNDFLMNTGEIPNNFLFLIPCSGISDIINNEDSYEFKFLKSKFFEKKYGKIKRDISLYYSKYNINVNRIYKRDSDYIIELVK
jgi:hypothetical protein